MKKKLYLFSHYDLFPFFVVRLAVSHKDRDGAYRTKSGEWVVPAFVLPGVVGEVLAFKLKEVELRYTRELVELQTRFAREVAAMGPQLAHIGKGKWKP